MHMANRPRQSDDLCDQVGTFNSNSMAHTSTSCTAPRGTTNGTAPMSEVCTRNSTDNASCLTLDKDQDNDDEDD